MRKKDKVIVIESLEQLQKFYNNLKIFKYYKNTNFILLNKDIFGVQPIIDALNIKNKKERIIYIYDFSVNYIDDYFSGKNFCGFKNNKCYVQRKNDCNYVNGCCRKCMYQSNKGCITKNLACKLFFCSEVKNRGKVPLKKDLPILNILTWQERYILLNDYFSLREDVIKDISFNSLIIGSVRMFYRIIFKRKK